MITWLHHLLYGKETLNLEDVTRAILSHEMRGKPINDHADGLVARPKHGRDKSKGKNGRGKQSRSKS
jgi:hypothetical protein